MIGYQFLIEIDAKLTDGTTDAPLYFCCQPSFSSGDGKTWVPCIIDPGLLQIDLFANGKTTGASSYSYGEIILANAKNITTLSGPLDTLKTNYRYYGCAVRMKWGTLATAYASFTTAYTATIESINVAEDTISFSIKGLQAALDVPVITNKFLGTSVLPSGVEGQDALKDTKEPLLIGRCFNFSPILCNSSLLIYAVSPNGGFDQSPTNMAEFHVYDNGVEIAFAGAQANQSALEAGNPPKGQYWSWGGYIRLGSSPAGVITCSGASTGRAMTAHPKNLITDMLTTAGLAASMIDGTSFTNFTDKGERGVYLRSEETLSSVIDRLVSPLGYWYFSSTGKLRFGLIADPSTLTPIGFILNSATNIETLSYEPAKDTKGGVPAKEVTIYYAKNYTVIAQPAGSVPQTRAAWLKEPYRKSTAAAAVAFPLSSELVFDTSLTVKNTTQVTAIKNLYTVERSVVTLTVITSQFLTASQIAPGDCMHINLGGRFGFDGSAKHMIVTGIQINYVQESVTLTLWG